MYVNKCLNKVETRLISFGDPFKCSPEVIVVITGSPGIPEFYWEFADHLHRCTQLPVCVVGHAGHDEKKQSETERLNWDLYNTEGQIQHKLDLINNHINKKSKLHLIGHSIGAWLLMELLHRNDLTERISSVNLLFPTLQNFSETKNGKLVNNFIRFLHRIILVFLFIILLMPTIRLFAIKVYLFVNSLPSYYVKRISIYLNPGVQEKSMLLAYESMDRIQELNRAAINKIKHMTNVLYSTEDGWVPMHHIQDLKTFGPHVMLTQVNVEHAFVLKSSVLVANVVGKLIMKKKNTSIPNAINKNTARKSNALYNTRSLT